jgi:hypothetical protein
MKKVLINLIMKTKLITKVSTTVVSLATVVSLSGAGALLPMTVHGQTVADLQAQLQALLAQVAALQAQLASQGAPAASGTVPASLLSSGDLTLGSRGAAVKDLQKFLNANGAQVAASGAGSPGNETETFGPLTQAALAKWQAANGVSPAAGYFGPRTRAKLSTLSAAPSAPTTPTTPAPAGTGLTLRLAPDQPAPALAPYDAQRVPFTKVQLTASADGDVTVNSLVVERTGLASDSALSGVVLLDENGVQLGIAKTLNSEHRATVGEALTVKAGQTRTLTVAGNRAAQGSLGGQTLSLAVVGANTSAAVNATFPLNGTTHTVNETLAIGSVTMLRGPLDPGAAQTKEVGTTGYTFSSVKVTAGSAEKVYLKSVRWNQTGSAGASDLANLKTWVDGTSYDVTASADGKYFTTVFPGKGLLMDKGFSKEASLRGDVKGGSSRTVAFDLAKRNDLYLVGETYGYGILAPQTNSCGASTGTSCFTSGEDPWYDGAVVTVSTGSMTVSTWTGVQAQNLAVNLQNQPLGGWTVDVKGESISVATMRFNLTLTESSGTAVGLNDLTNITIFDESGRVLAGPVDGSGTAKSGTITFTDTVTFPVGLTRLVMKAKLGTDFDNNDTLAASTTPGTGWTTVTGQTTGNTITPSPSSALTGPTMTVRGANLSVTVSSQPSARTVIAGSTGFEFARYILDASGSGEDVRLTSLPLAYDTTGTASNSTNCQLYDGIDANATSLTTGSNVKNPTSTSSSTVMTFDGTGVTIAKGTTKTLSLRCNLAAGATGVYRWGLDSDQASSFTGATGLTSGQTITETLNDSIGQNMTAATAGAYTVAADTSVLYKVAQAGTTVTLGALKFTANDTEDLNIQKVALQLGNTASNSPADLVGQKVTLWDGGTLVGEAQFGLGSPDFATSTLSTPVRVARGETKTVTLKGELAAQNVTEGTPGAFLRVDYDGDNNGLNGNYATGVSSGQTINGTSADQATNGVRIFRTIPTLADATTNTALAAGADMYALTVTAGSGRDAGLYKMTFKVATTGATVADWQLYGPSGAVNATAVQASGATGSQIVEVVFDNNAVDRLVPAGTSKTYRLRANTVSGLTAANTETVNIQLAADTAYPSLANLMGSAAGIDATTADEFIWTPFSTTTPTSANTADTNLDWTNSYGLPGFPGLGQDMPVRVFSH